MKNTAFPFACLMAFLLSCCMTSCVSKKKHREILNNLQVDYQTELDTQSQQYGQQLSEARTTIKNLELSLAERKGENNMLLLLRKELESQIDSLEHEIEVLGSRSESNSQNFQQEIREKEREIERLKSLFAQIDQVLLDYEQTLGTFAGDLRAALAAYPEKKCNIITSFGKVRVVLSEDLVFKGSSATRMDNEGLEVLEIFSDILQRFPSLVVQVTGHSDNRPPANRGYKDNWNYCVIRAASVSRYLVDELNVTPNQIVAVGKNEYAPLASNSTEEGREQNRRIELEVSPLVRDLARVIKGVIEKVPNKN